MLHVQCARHLAGTRLKCRRSKPLAQELVERYGELSADGRVNLLGVARGLSSLPEYRAPDVPRPPQP